jgi:putative hemolysin
MIANASNRTDPSIIDTLIEERAGGLLRRPWLWRALRPVLFAVLGYWEARAMHEAIGGAQADEAFHWMADWLALDLAAIGLDHVPEKGPVMIIANHPGGIPDGIALWQALQARRPDLIFFANRDATRVCEGLAPAIIPVEWRADQRSAGQNRITLKAAMAALSQGRCVICFPAGRIAQWRWKAWRLVDPDWAATPLTLARKFGAPIIPLRVKARMSFVYYGAAQISQTLKNMTLFHEFRAARKRRWRLAFLPPEPLPDDEKSALAALRIRVHA